MNALKVPKIAPRITLWGGEEEGAAESQVDVGLDTEVCEIGEVVGVVVIVGIEVVGEGGEIEVVAGPRITVSVIKPEVRATVRVMT